MISPAHGMGSLIAALEEKVRKKLGSRVYLNHKLTELPSDTNIVLCVPASEASRLLSPLDANASRTLQFVCYAPLVTSTVILRRDSHQPPDGVGFLVPPRENLPILGVLFNSSAFSGRVHDESYCASYTVMMGGTVSPHWIDADDAEIRRTIELQLQALFGLKDGAEEIQISKWPQAVPIYGPELSNAWAALRSGWCRNAGNIFFGNASGQVSLRGMIEEIYSWSEPSALIQSG
jgi:oxygen-dependent protoporphyrinogen oxidase